MSGVEVELIGAHFPWGKGGMSLSIGHHFDPQLAPARAVKFAQEDSLPAAQNYSPALDEQQFRVPNHRSLQVRIAIAVVMVIVPVTWREGPQENIQVLLQSMIIIFVD